MAVFSTSAALLRCLLLHAGLLTISFELDPTIIPWAATSNPLAMTPQIRNTIAALIGTSDFGSWATDLSGSDSPNLPLSATFFILADQTLSRASIQSYIDQATFLFHIFPRGRFSTSSSSRSAFALPQFKNQIKSVNVTATDTPASWIRRQGRRRWRVIGGHSKDGISRRRRQQLLGLRLRGWGRK